jgi:phosphoribosylcarboxyaminoimidazole (NCAIR) mutase
MILLNTEKTAPIPIVAILMGSISDADTMEPARQILKEFDLLCEMKVLSAHRTL